MVSASLNKTFPSFLPNTLIREILVFCTDRLILNRPHIGRCQHYQTTAALYRSGGSIKFMGGGGGEYVSRGHEHSLMEGWWVWGGFIYIARFRGGGGAGPWAPLDLPLHRTNDDKTCIDYWFCIIRYREYPMHCLNGS